MANKSTPVSLPSQMYVKKPGDKTTTKMVGNPIIYDLSGSSPSYWLPNVWHG